MHLSFQALEEAWDQPAPLRCSNVAAGQMQR
jgi:hypothetical protein